MHVDTRSRNLRFLSIAVVTAIALVGCSQPSPTPSPSPSVVASPTEPSQTASQTPSPSPSRAADPLPDGPVTALLIGSDGRTPGSMTGQADTIMLAQLSADRQSLSLISVSRDSWVSIPGRGAGKINSAFANGGTELLRSTVSNLFGGLEIDYVVQTDFEGFIGLTRALGGFSAVNQYPTEVTVLSTGRVVDFTADPVELTGTDGLIYVRQRKGLPLGDLDRTERQRAAIIGMLSRIDEIAGDPAALATLIGHVASRVKITGDLSVDDMLALAAMTKELEGGSVHSLLAPISGFGTRDGQSINEVDAAQTAALGDALRAGDLDGYVEKFGTGYAP